MYQLLTNNYVEDDDNMFRQALLQEKHCLACKQSHFLFLLAERFHATATDLIWAYATHGLREAECVMQVQVLARVLAMGAAAAGVARQVGAGRASERQRQAGGVHHGGPGHDPRSRRHRQHGRDKLPLRAQEAAPEAPRPRPHQGDFRLLLFSLQSVYMLHAANSYLASQHAQLATGMCEGSGTHCLHCHMHTRAGYLAFTDLSMY